VSGPTPIQVANGGWVCSVTTGALTVARGELTLTVGVGIAGESYEVTSAPATLGTCKLNGSLPPQQGSLNTSIHYDCDFGQTIPKGTDISLIARTSGGLTAPSIQVLATAPEIPGPAVETVAITPTPTLTAIDPSSGTAGTVVTLTGTNLTVLSRAIVPVPTTVAFGTAQATSVNCNDAGTAARPRRRRSGRRRSGRSWGRRLT
jgi:hypothetical protein